MHSAIRTLEHGLKNPYVEAVLGIVIMSCGIVEAGSEIFSDVAQGDLGAHHGVILLGLAHAIKAVPAILAGVTLIAVAEEQEDNRR